MKALFLGVLLVALPTLAQACDVCGCSVAGGGFGLVSGTTQHFVGVSYSTIGYDNRRAPVRDRLHRVQLAGQATLFDYWRVSLTVPVLYNVRYDERAPTLDTRGLGDVSLAISYALADRRLDNGGRLLLTVGAGAQLPTGQFDPDIYWRPLPEDFNPGRGALVPSVTLRGQLTGGPWGVLAQAQAERPGYNEADYRYGDRFTGQAKALRRFATAWAGIVTTAGLDYRYVGESQRAESGNALHGSGGKALAGRLGFQLERNDFVLALDGTLPLYERYAEDATASTLGFELTLLRKL